MTVEYQLGNAEPQYAPDIGAGAWKSSPTQMTYAALAASVVASLPFAYGIVGDDAAKHMLHYFLSSGTTYQIDLEGMVRDVPSASARFEREVAQAKAFVELLPPGRHEITSRQTQDGYNDPDESRNWYFAIGGYHVWGQGAASVADVGGERNCELDFAYHFRDRYNWDKGKEVTIFDVLVTDVFMAEFHRQGLAREFDCTGVIRRKFNWKAGRPIAPDQKQAPLGRV